MLDSLELSPSDRAKCSRCGKKIGLKTPRGVSLLKQSYGYSESYYCYECSEKEIDESIISLKELKKELKKMVKKSQKAIILQNL